MYNGRAHCSTVYKDDEGFPDQHQPTGARLKVRRDQGEGAIISQRTSQHGRDAQGAGWECIHELLAVLPALYSQRNAPAMLAHINCRRDAGRDGCSNDCNSNFEA